MRLPAHPTLRRSARFTLFDEPSANALAEFLTLLLFGALAGVCVAMIDFNLKMPGHAILRTVFPLACGLALVPRRGAGTTMGAAGFATAMLLQMGGQGDAGPGALTSLCVVGPCLDAALWAVRDSRWVYVGFALAGLAANTIAFAVRGITKYSGGPLAGGKPFATWWPTASATYAVCGIVAGLLSAAVWFRFNSREGTEP